VSAILDAAYQLVHAYPGGAPSLAPRMGKNPTTLSHEVKRTGAAKFGLEDAVLATVLAGDLRILNAFAAEAECMVLPLPRLLECGSGAMEQVGKLAHEFGDLVATVSTATADGRISANELAQVERDGADLIAAVQALLAHMRAKHEAGLPGGEGAER
jgi:hypothetical protein